MDTWQIVAWVVVIVGAYELLRQITVELWREAAEKRKVAKTRLRTIEERLSNVHLDVLTTKSVAKEALFLVKQIEARTFNGTTVGKEK